MCEMLVIYVCVVCVSVLCMYVYVACMYATMCECESGVSVVQCVWCVGACVHV